MTGTEYQQLDSVTTQDGNTPTDNNITDNEHLTPKKESTNTDLQNLDSRSKILLTLVYCSNYMTLGCFLGVAGPTLLFLAQNTDSSVADVGEVFITRGAGWLIGTIVAAKIYEIADGHSVVIAALFTAAVLTLLVPFIHNLWVLLALFTTSGFLLSFVDVGVNTFLVVVWGNNVGPYMQLLHFFFGVGASTAPFILGVALTIRENLRSALSTYWTLGSIMIVTILPLVYFTFVLKIRPSAKHREEANSTAVQLTKTQFYTIFVLFGLFLTIYVGAETGFGGWIFYYAHNTYHLSESESAYIASTFWIAITATRLLAVPVSVRMKPTQMLMGTMTICTVAIMLFIFVAPFTSRIALWILTVLFGIGMACVYGTLFSVPAQMNLDVNSRATSIMICGASIGEMVIPAITGIITTSKLFGKHSLIFVMMFKMVVALAIFASFMVANKVWIAPKTKEYSNLELNTVEDLDTQPESALHDVEGEHDSFVT